MKTEKELKKIKDKDKNKDKKKKQNIEKFKQKYFEYYDDVKSESKGREDW